MWGCAGPIPSISRLKPRSINGGMSDVSSDYPSIDIRARYCTLGSAVQCDSLSLPGLCVACVCVCMCVCVVLWCLVFRRNTLVWPLTSKRTSAHCCLNFLERIFSVLGRSRVCACACLCVHAYGLLCVRRSVCINPSLILSVHAYETCTFVVE